MVRTLPLHSATRPEPARILAIAAAIAVHAFAFLLLLIPMAASGPPKALTDKKPEIEWLLPKVTPVTPIPPETVAVRKPKTTTKTPPSVAPIVVASVPDQVIVEQGTVATEPTLDTSTPQVSLQPDPGQPLSGMQLEYASTPPPPYPRDAFREGLQGQVLLKILVDTDGAPLEVVVSRSSGHRVLDDAARRFVLKHWRFRPALRNGQPVQAYGMVPIDFTLQ